MANDQYIPPIMRGEVQDAAEPISDTPERYTPGKPYGELVEWGQALRSYRQTALTLNQAERARMTFLERMTTLPSDAPRTMDEMLNRDFVAGGKRFGDNHLFGLTERNPEVEERYGEPVLDFLYAKMQPGRAEPLFALTYRVTASFVEKIYEGSSYPLTIGELEHFMHVVQDHRTFLRHEFYPIDDLIESDDDDQQQYALAA